MRTVEPLDTYAGWVAAQDQRRLCARPGCGKERLPDRGSMGTVDLCFGCALEAELFDREARWTALRR